MLMNRRGFILAAILVALPSLAYAKDFVLGWSRWSVVAQGVLLDSQTGLQWTQEDNGSDIDWNSAQQYCQSSTWAGGRWRLPKVDELTRIYDEKVQGLECGTSQFGKIEHCRTATLFHLTSHTFWTGTPGDPYKGSPTYQYVFLGSGFHAAGLISIVNGDRALCVRP